MYVKGCAKWQMQQVKEEDNGLEPKAGISLWSRAIKYAYISMSLSMFVCVNCSVVSNSL